jgi:hypothetical protein
MDKLKTLKPVSYTIFVVAFSSFIPLIPNA